MTDLSKLTAKDFSDAMHAGWSGKKFCDLVFFQKKGRPVELDQKPTECCAIGAMAIHFNCEPLLVLHAMQSSDVPDLKRQIVEANDNAGNKRAAMKAVDAILLGSKS